MKKKFLWRAALPLVAVCMGLAACSKSTTTTVSSPPTAVALLRFTPAGALDTSFAGGKGVAVTEFEAGLNDYALATALQSTGEILVAGSAGRTLTSGVQQAQVAVLRYDLFGSLDKSFGTNGGVTTPIGSDNAEAVGVVQQANGKIVVAASILSPDFTGKGIAIVRYNANGTLDTAFGTTGIVTVPVIGTGTDTNAAALALQP